MHDARVVQAELRIEHDLPAGRDLQHRRERRRRDGLFAAVPRVVVTDRVGELHDAVPLHVELHLAVLLADELAVQRHGYVPSCAPVTGMIAPLT